MILKEAVRFLDIPMRANSLPPTLGDASTSYCTSKGSRTGRRRKEGRGRRGRRRGAGSEESGGRGLRFEVIRGARSFEGDRRDSTYPRGNRDDAR